MADFISGINRIGPSYPVKPARPAQKDREKDERKKQPQDEPEPRDHDDDDRKPIIDEHV